MIDFENKLKGMPKKSIPVYVEIYKILKEKEKSKTSVTSYDIYDNMNKKIREELTPAKITQKLEVLRKKQFVKKTNKNITYITDVINNTPLYGLDIMKKFLEYLSELLNNAQEDEEILNIVINHLSLMINNSENNEEAKSEMSQLVKQLKENKEKLSDTTNYLISCCGNGNNLVFKLYNDIFKDIKDKGLYNEHKLYGELKRKNTANKYKLI